MSSSAENVSGDWNVQINACISTWRATSFDLGRKKVASIETENFESISIRKSPARLKLKRASSSARVPRRFSRVVHVFFVTSPHLHNARNLRGSKERERFMYRGISRGCVSNCQTSGISPQWAGTFVQSNKIIDVRAVPVRIITRHYDSSGVPRSRPFFRWARRLVFYREMLFPNIGPRPSRKRGKLGPRTWETRDDCVILGMWGNWGDFLRSCENCTTLGKGILWVSEDALLVWNPSKFRGKFYEIERIFLFD